jgi:hypothetical protein
MNYRKSIAVAGLAWIGITATIMGNSGLQPVASLFKDTSWKEIACCKKGKCPPQKESSGAEVLTFYHNDRLSSTSSSAIKDFRIVSSCSLKKDFRLVVYKRAFMDTDSTSWTIHVQDRDTLIIFYPATGWYKTFVRLTDY